jgi:2-C-methyl-D-erythritol 4-phosphate cytidylyltransferase
MIYIINNLIREAEKEKAALPVFPVNESTIKMNELHDWINTLVLIRDRYQFENE